MQSIHGLPSDFYLHKGFIHASFLTLIVHIVTEDLKLHRASGPNGLGFFLKKKINFSTQILEFLAIWL